MDAYHILDPLRTGLFFFLLRLHLKTGLRATTTIYCRLKRLVVLILSHALIYGHVLMYTVSAIFSEDRYVIDFFICTVEFINSVALVPTNIFVLNLMIWQLN